MFKNQAASHGSSNEADNATIEEPETSDSRGSTQMCAIPICVHPRSSAVSVAPRGEAKTNCPRLAVEHRKVKVAMYCRLSSPPAPRRQNVASNRAGASSVVARRSCRTPRRNSQEAGLCRQKCTPRQNSCDKSLTTKQRGHRGPWGVGRRATTYVAKNVISRHKSSYRPRSHPRCVRISVSRACREISGKLRP
jgi:hypothetical protein